MRAIGLMSGTSMDGIDVALIETDGETVTRFGPSALPSYQDGEVTLLRRRHGSRARHCAAATERPGVIAEAEKMVDGAACRSAVNAFLVANGIERGSVDVVGYHGQTMLHRPEVRLTVQIGDGAELARETGIAGGLRFPRRRRCGRRKRRAAGAGHFTARSRVRWRARIRSRCSISAASPISPSLTARTIRSPATPGRPTR